MNILEICKNTLKEAINEKKDYFEIFSKYAKENSLTEKDRTHCLILINSFFRNYFFINETTNFLFGDKSKEDLIYPVGLYFVNNGLVKVLPEEETLNYLKDVLLANNINLDVEDNVLLALNHICYEKRKFEFPKLKRGSLKFFSVKFNLPEWFIKMMIKHYGKEDGIKVCREFSKNPKQFAMVNTFKAPIPGSEELTKNFKEIKTGVYEYIGKGPFKRNALIKDRNLINVQLAYTDLLDKLPSLTRRNYSIYLGIKSFFYMTLLSKYYKDYNYATIITKELKENYELLSLKKNYGIKSLFFSEANSDSLKAIISKKQDLFIVFPKSSEFEKARTNPDYFITFNQDNLDSLINNELSDLENVLEFLEEKATLVYCVRTLGNKETTEIIAKFLEKHPEFELIEEKQYLPSMEENSLLYYAILRKK